MTRLGLPNGFGNGRGGWRSARIPARATIAGRVGLPPESCGYRSRDPTSPNGWYNSYTHTVRSHFGPAKSERLRKKPKRGIGFEEAQEIFSRPYYLEVRNDLPLQHIAIGWVGRKLYSLIFEVREDDEGEFYHLVTLWKATREERELYEDNA